MLLCGDLFCKGYGRGASHYLPQNKCLTRIDANSAATMARRLRASADTIADAQPPSPSGHKAPKPTDWRISNPQVIVNCLRAKMRGELA